MSLSVWRVWIEIKSHDRTKWIKFCHSLYGECGLKYQSIVLTKQGPQSLSVWRVWIEIGLKARKKFGSMRHSLYGECGLKLLLLTINTN